MDGFRFSAAHIFLVTHGHLKLKTLNNWATNNEWASELQKPSRGHPRLFSRVNVLEAVVASELMKLGISRSECKWAVGSILRMEGTTAVEERDAFLPGADGWFVWLSIVGYGDERHLTSVGIGPLEGLTSIAADGVTLVLPLSEMLEKIDALDPKRQKESPRRAEE